MGEFVLDQTPTEISEKIREFCRSISTAEPTYLHVEPVEGAAERDCFGVVSAQVKKHGGSIIYGWSISTFPGAWLKAEHHAVWQPAEGNLLDITPKQNGDTRALFLPNPTRPFDFKTSRRLPNTWQHGSADGLTAAIKQAEMDLWQYEEDHSAPGSFVVRANRAVYMRLQIATQVAIATFAVSRLSAKAPCLCRSGMMFKDCHKRKFLELLSRTRIR